MALDGAAMPMALASLLMRLGAESLLWLISRVLPSVRAVSIWVSMPWFSMAVATVAEVRARLTQEDIDDIMVGALEGGINYWCREAEVVGEYLGEYASEQISRGGALTLYDAESSDKWTLDLEKFLNGVKLWLQNGDDRYGALQRDGALDTGEIDGEMADMIVQYAIFGEVQFG